MLFLFKSFNYLNKILYVDIESINRYFDINSCILLNCGREYSPQSLLLRITIFVLNISEILKILRLEEFSFYLSNNHIFTLPQKPICLPGLNEP